METKYFKDEIPGENVMYLSQRKDTFIKIIIYGEEEASIELLKGYEWLALFDFVECSQGEFDRAYLQAYSQIHTEILSRKSQTRDELIRNLSIASDQHDF